MKNYDVCIIGAGAAGLFCAYQLKDSGLKVAVLESNKGVGKKILISGGGRCNFTNIHHAQEHLHGENPHFHKSAQSQYTAYDFIDLIQKRGIDYFEKTLGQLFCQKSARDITNFFEQELQTGQTDILTSTKAHDVQWDQGFIIKTNQGEISATDLVIASGGLSLPSIGASDIGHQIAQKFDHQVTTMAPALVPLTLDQKKEKLDHLSGVSLPVKAWSQRGPEFEESLLFTHKGLSGPVILQVSSFWKEGEEITINFLPDHDLNEVLKTIKHKDSKRTISLALKPYFPTRYSETWLKRCGLDAQKRLAEFSDKQILALSQSIHRWRIKPSGTEGYRKAEVTRGGVSVEDVSSKTMESKKRRGLYFIGEVLDVTGHLGGHNFQWAWSSAFVCSQALLSEDRAAHNS